MAQIRGYVDYQQVFVWTDGQITGTRYYVGNILAADARYQLTRLGPPEGPFSEGDHIETALGFMFLLGTIVTDDGLVLQGDIPPDRDAKDADGNWLL